MLTQKGFSSADRAAHISALELRPSTGAHTLPLAAMLLFIGALVLSATPGLVVQDTWLALVSGREIIQHGLPLTDHLTVLGQGRRWIDQQWLGHVTLYGVDRIGGLKAVIASSAFLSFVGFALPAWTAFRRGASLVALGPALLVALTAAPWALQVRTQCFGIACFGAAIALALSDPDVRSRRSVVVIPLLCVWANLHGSVALGVVVVSAWGALALARNGWSLTRITLTFLPPFCLFASPYGTRLVGYYRLMLVNPPFSGQNVEWARTTPGALTAVFFGAASVTAFVLVRHRSRFSALELTMLGITFLSALAAVRGIVWFALAALAVVTPVFTTGVRRRSSARRMGVVTAVAFSLFAVAAIGLVSSQPAPPAAPGVRALVEAHPGARVFADDRRADWLLWEIPSLRGRLAYDARFEVLTRGAVDRLATFADARGPHWSAAAHGYDLVVADSRAVRQLTSLLRLAVILDDGHTAVARAR